MFCCQGDVNTIMQLNLVSEQFLCGIPIHRRKGLPFLELLHEDLPYDELCRFQDYLLDITVKHPSNLKYPVDQTCQFNFLKHLILSLEEKKIEVNESLYSSFRKLANISKSSINTYKHYVLPNDGIISLCENIPIISEGTTGLCSWQGAFLLSEWCMKNPNIFSGKNVLELGSGIGLSGLIVCSMCNPKCFSFSDVHDAVLNRLCYNIKINSNVNKSDESVQTNFENLSIFDVIWNETEIKVLKLDWTNFHIDEFLQEIVLPDIILAADCVYDPSLIEPFCRVLQCFLERNIKTLIIIACSIRSEETHELFLKTLDELDMATEKISVDWKPRLHFTVIGQVVLYSVSKKSIPVPPIVV